MKDGKLQWHTAFSAAMHIEFREEMEKLRFEEEHILGKKPMQIDLLIIKMRTEEKIRKNIGKIFREHNIIEYKSPEDYLSINDFYKVYGYACFYQADTNEVEKIRPEELTITFVTNHYPRKMVEHIKKQRGIEVRQRGQGIYELVGDPIPMQIIVPRKLSKKENYWLQSLRTDLKAGEEIREYVASYEKEKHGLFYRAVADVVFRANWKTMEEEKKMCDALRELFAEELKESKEEGISVGMTRGISQGILKGILVLLDTYQEMNLSEEEAERRITEKFSLSEEKAREYMEKYWGR